MLIFYVLIFKMNFWRWSSDRLPRCIQDSRLVISPRIEEKEETAGSKYAFLSCHALFLRSALLILPVKEHPNRKTVPFSLRHTGGNQPCFAKPIFLSTLIKSCIRHITFHGSTQRIAKDVIMMVFGFTQVNLCSFDVTLRQALKHGRNIRPNGRYVISCVRYFGLWWQ